MTARRRRMSWAKSVRAGAALDRRLARIKAKNPRAFMAVQLLIEAGRV